MTTRPTEWATDWRTSVVDEEVLRAGVAEVRTREPVILASGDTCPSCGGLVSFDGACRCS